MRATSYVIAFVLVLIALTLNIVSVSRIDWLVIQTPEVLNTVVTVKYGLRERCEWAVVNIGGGQYINKSCVNFPLRRDDYCEGKNSTMCTEWFTAGYSAELALGCGALSLLCLLFGVSTRSRRRRIWKTVAVLVALHATFQLVTFSLITDAYNKSPLFKEARPGFAYVSNITSWVSSILIVSGVVITGLFAERGHQWAAGNRAYQPIEG